MKQSGACSKQLQTIAKWFGCNPFYFFLSRCYGDRCYLWDVWVVALIKWLAGQRNLVDVIRGLMILAAIFWGNSKRLICHGSSIPINFVTRYHALSSMRLLVIKLSMGGSKLYRWTAERESLMARPYVRSSYKQPNSSNFVNQFVIALKEPTIVLQSDWSNSSW